MNRAVLLLVKCILVGNVLSVHKELMMYDFTKAKDLSRWIEQSDVMKKGSSKASLVLQTSELSQTAVLFTLLNPDPKFKGAFAGYKTETNLDLSEYKCIAMRVRGQGSNRSYKIILRHKGQDESYPNYVHFFTAPSEDFDTITVTLNDFQPYYRGKLIENATPLDTTQITSFGIQMYAGAYLPIKQSGTSSLEIEWILALD